MNEKEQAAADHLLELLKKASACEVAGISQAYSTLMHAVNDRLIALARQAK